MTIETLWGRGWAWLGALALVGCLEAPNRAAPGAPQGMEETEPEHQPAAPPLSHVVSLAHHEAMNVALAVDERGQLFAAHRPAPGDQLVVSRLDRASWRTIAGALNERPTAHLATLAFDRQGTLHAAFLQETVAGDGYELVVRQVKGEGWQDCADRVVVGTAHFHFKADLGFDLENRLLLAYADQEGRLQVKRRDRAGWTTLAALGTRRYGIRLVVKPDGQPVVAYLQGREGSDETTLEVIARAGEHWVPVGGTVDRSLTLAELLSPPRLDWDAHGGWLAWTRGSVVGVARSSGGDWKREPLTPPMPVRSGRIAFALIDGGALLATGIDIWFGTRLRRFHQGAWGPELDATPADVRGLGTGPILVTGSGGAAYLAFPGIGTGDLCPLEQLRFEPEIE